MEVVGQGIRREDRQHQRGRQSSVNKNINSTPGSNNKCIYSMEYIKKMVREMYRGIQIATKNYLEGRTGWGKF